VQHAAEAEGHAHGMVPRARSDTGPERRSAGTARRLRISSTATSVAAENT
jgi:hypothetical protein